MKVNIEIPPAGESVTEATIASIIKPSGSIVKKEEEILEIETEKVNQIIYAPEAGKLELTVNVDDTVKIGQVVGSIDTDAAVPAEEAPTPAPAPEPAAEASPPPSEVSARRTPEDFVSSIGKKEEEKPAPAPVKKVTSEGQTRKRMSGLRKTVARRLVEVKNQTAMLTTFNEVDMQQVMEIRAREKENFEKKHGVRLGFMSFFIKACAQGLKTYPDINAFIDGDEIVYNSDVNMSLAVSTEKGLMVPVVKAVQDMSFADIEKSIIDYANRAREGKIAIEELEGGTFTITNAGKFGSMLSTPIINPPQSAILGMHNIVKRPIVIDDQIVIRPIMYLALSYDHRIVDGETAVRFLMHVRECLEEPSRIMLDF